MKMLILEPPVKAIAPNMALMKFVRWCEIFDVELYDKTMKKSQGQRTDLMKK